MKTNLDLIMDDLTSQDLLGLVCEIDPNLCLKIKIIQSFEIIFIYLESIILLNIPETKFGICFPICAGNTSSSYILLWIN